MILATVSTVVVGLSLAAMLAYLVPALVARRVGAGNAQVSLWLAWTLHGLVLAWVLLGPELRRFGFAPALSMTAWLVLTVYVVERQLFPQLRARAALSMLGAASVGLALLFPGTQLHAAASPWLALHWALGLASYGLFGAAVVHAALMQRAERQIRTASERDQGVPLLMLERITFRFVQAGFVLLTATLLAGWLFSESLYGAAGKSWQWNHKTVFTVLSWLVFAGLLWGRARMGWRGKRATRVLYVGASLLLLAYVGSRFVLEVVLHRGMT